MTAKAAHYVELSESAFFLSLDKLQDGVDAFLLCILEIINTLFEDLKRDIANHIAQHLPDETSALDVLMIGKYLERIGDHVVNIAEWVEYAITGNHKGMTIADEAE